MVKVHVGNRHTDLYPTAKNSATFLFLYVNLDEWEMYEYVVVCISKYFNNATFVII